MSIPHPDLEFDRFLMEGRFMLQRSPASGRFIFPPRVAEPRTGNTALEWAPASGRGTIYAVTTVFQKPPTPNRTLALIDLVEGPRLLARLEGENVEALRIGASVQARIDTQGGRPLLVFAATDRPTTTGAENE